MQKSMKTVIFFGVLWGFWEASLGGILHYLLFPYTGQIMGSIAFILLLRAMRKGVSISGIFVISSIAAAIKLVDLYIFPGNPGAVLKPAMAILSQGLAFAVVTSIFHLPEKKGVKFLSGLLVTGWLSLGISHILAAVLLEPLHELQHIHMAFFLNVPLMMLAVFMFDSMTRKWVLMPWKEMSWRWSSLLLFLAFVGKFIFQYVFV